TFDRRLREAYQAAMDRGLWKNTYLTTNHSEYWSEGVQAYFDCMRPQFGANRREKLEKYDEGLFKLVDEVYKQSKFRYVRYDQRKKAEDAPATSTDPGVTVVTTFPGDSGPGPKDAPDHSGAVGPDHVVDFTNANVVIHDKKIGHVIRRMTQTEFWKSANPEFDFPKLNDPRLLYDPLSKRWFGVIAEFKKLSIGYLAVSQSS